MGVDQVLTALRSAWQNAERLIGSIRRECLDHVLGLAPPLGIENKELNQLRLPIRPQSPHPLLEFLRLKKLDDDTLRRSCVRRRWRFCGETATVGPVFRSSAAGWAFAHDGLSFCPQ